jgi:hypothetical protein
MAANCLTMTTRLYIFCSFILPNYLICLCHIDHSVSLDLEVTTSSLSTLGIALCHFRCTEVMVPYELVWIEELCEAHVSFLPTSIRCHDE